MKTFVVLSAVIFQGLLASSGNAQQALSVPITAEAINAVDLSTAFLPQTRAYIFGPEQTIEESTPSDAAASDVPNAAIVRLQVLLDQFGASPGVIDGFDGENVRKAIMSFQAMNGLPQTGNLDDDLLMRLETGQAVVGQYVIADIDAEYVTGPTPEDYADKAALDLLGYADISEAVAERFHMDIDLLLALNPGAAFAVGETVVVTAPGTDRTGMVSRIEADKALRQVRAYDSEGVLLAAYPATIGSQDNPSPSGSYLVEVVASMPNYTYNPEINFQQGANTGVLTIPPGPNGPVGSMWIALSKPTYGIHGTPEPSLIDKTGSHGCVRLTNWDAGELALMVEPGVRVDFVE